MILVGNTSPIINLAAVGQLGLLRQLYSEAKHAGLIPAVRPIMDNLIEKAGFWIGHELYEKVLQVAGE